MHLTGESVCIIASGQHEEQNVRCRLGTFILPRARFDTESLRGVTPFPRDPLTGIGSLTVKRYLLVVVCLLQLLRFFRVRENIGLVVFVFSGAQEVQ
jgi:hypothetical protein